MSKHTKGSADRTPSERADVCVVGSGPAGALVSYSLAQRGYDVVILEAGKRFDIKQRLAQMEKSLRPSHDSLEIWDMGGKRDDYTNSGEITYPLNSRRVKGVGGSTLHWGGRLQRLKQKDFEMQSRYGVATDWPISYRDLQPYYAEAEKELGVAGPANLPFGPPRKESPPMDAFPPSYSDQLFAEACEKLGITVHPVAHAKNSEEYDGRNECVAYGTCSPVCPSGAKYSADVHISKAEDHGARLIDRVPVQKLHHDDSGERIVAAEYVTPQGDTHKQEARQFVLACGGVEIPRLLLLSKSQTYPDGLANSSGVVGRYFEERPTAILRAQVDRETRQHLIGFGTSESHQFYNIDTVPPGSIKIQFGNTAGPGPADLALGRGPSLHDVRTGFRNATDVATWTDLIGVDPSIPWGDELLESMRQAYGNSLKLSAAVEDLPQKENSVTLNKSITDNHGNPVPDISWSASEYATKTMDHAFSIMHDILDQLDAEVRSRSEFRFWKGIGHHIGTTRMGDDPSDSVVNSQLRTHDLENLFIVSSSVFVTSGAMQPTLTIAALALRVAEHLDQWL